MMEGDEGFIVFLVVLFWAYVIWALFETAIGVWQLIMMGAPIYLF